MDPMKRQILNNEKLLQVTEDEVGVLLRQYGGSLRLAYSWADGRVVVIDDDDIRKYGPPAVGLPVSHEQAEALDANQEVGQAAAEQLSERLGRWHTPSWWQYLSAAEFKALEKRILEEGM